MESLNTLKRDFRTWRLKQKKFPTISYKLRLGEAISSGATAIKQTLDLYIK